MPNQFLELLKLENLKIVGVSVGGNLAKIGRDFRCNNIMKTLKNVSNLSNLLGKEM